MSAMIRNARAAHKDLAVELLNRVSSGGLATARVTDNSEIILKSRLTLPAQPVDATPCSTLIRQCLLGRTTCLVALNQNLARAVTSPSFCTTASERVYITTSSGKDAKGGSQGAVGDRRATLCGANAAGAGAL
jgi:hypothetical protein